MALQPVILPANMLQVDGIKALNDTISMKTLSLSINSVQRVTQLS